MRLEDRRNRQISLVLAEVPAASGGGSMARETAKDAEVAKALAAEAVGMDWVRATVASLLVESVVMDQANIGHCMWRISHKQSCSSPRRGLQLDLIIVCVPLWDGPSADVPANEDGRDSNLKIAQGAGAQLGSVNRRAECAG